MNNELTSACGVAALLEAGKKLAQGRVDEVQGVPHYFDPDGKMTSLENLLSQPRRHKGVERFTDLESFIFRTNTLKRAQSLLRVGSDPDSFLLVTCDLEPSTVETPSWNDWQLRCNLAIQPEWTTWIGKGLQFSQDDFIEFIQHRSEDITDPDAAELLELIQDLSSTEGQESQSFSRNFGKDGKVTYKQKVTGADGAEIPSKLTIAIPVWLDDVKYQATVLVTAKVRDAKPIFILKVKNPEKIQLQATKDILDMLAEKTSLPVYR